MKKIMYVYHVSTIGGGSLCLYRIIESLDRSKYEPVVLLKSPGPLYDKLINMNVKVVIEKSITTIPYNKSLISFNSIKSYFFSIISILKIYYWIKEEKIDILHINTMMLYFYSIPAVALNKKVVLHLREHWPIGEHRFQFQFARLIINKYSTKIVAINKTSAKILNLLKKTEVIYDWVDFSKKNKKVILPEDKIDLSKDKSFLFLGGYQKIKGAYEVLFTFSKKIKNKSVKLLFVCSESKEFSNKGLKGIIKNILRKIYLPVLSDKIKIILQNDDRIICIPHTENIKSLYKSTNCVVAFPTIPHAILPIAECIILGIPVISVDTQEAREYSNKGKSAILVQMNNIVSLKKAMIEFINNETVYKLNTMKSSTIVRAKFDKNKNSAALNKLYYFL